jgi:hypothetical protein
VDFSNRIVGGRYRLRALLGSGGMAAVYRAWDPHLERDVAVKLLHPTSTDRPGSAERFRAEARMAGSLAHPNVVNVYDYGEDAGLGYIVMELVDGEDLATLLRRRTPLTAAKAARIAIGVTRALEAAHAHGLIHRDVKPGNILLTHEGDVRVADFGISRAMRAAGSTTAGMVIGSVDYFSPEQARGDEATPASDLYALGVVLYEMLAGRRPFEASSAAAVAIKRLHEDPAPPSRYAPGVPAELERIVMRAMQRDPRRRFPSAAAMRAALQAFLARDAARAGAVARRPLAWLALPVVATLLVAALFVAGYAAASAVDLRFADADAGAKERGRAPVSVAVAEPTGAITVTPTPQPTPVVTPEPTQTPEATPEPTPPPSATPPPPSPTPVPVADAQQAVAVAANPADTVAAFYRFVVDEQFREAEALWTDEMRQRYPPAGNIDGRWDDTHAVSIQRLEIVALDEATGYALVAVDFIETSGSPATTTRYIGTWELVRRDGRWLLHEPHF